MNQGLSVPSPRANGLPVGYSGSFRQGRKVVTSHGGGHHSCRSSLALNPFSLKTGRPSATPPIPFTPATPKALWGAHIPSPAYPEMASPHPNERWQTQSLVGYTHEAVCSEPIVIQEFLRRVGENYQTKSAPGQDLTLCAIDAIVRPDASSSFGGRHSRMPGRTPSEIAMLGISVPPCQTRSKQYAGSAWTALPAGAPWDGAGVNFALCADHATSVELCLFDGADGH
jgi:hypothetical protein